MDSVNEIGRCKDCFLLEGFRNIVVMKKRSSHIKEVFHLPFSYPILLGGINTRRFMDCSFLLEVLVQVMIKIISCIISS